jgi:hypothetical protein
VDFSETDQTRQILEPFISLKKKTKTKSFIACGNAGGGVVAVKKNAGM